jgi:hypothetical protein
MPRLVGYLRDRSARARIVCSADSESAARKAPLLCLQCLLPLLALLPVRELPTVADAVALGSLLPYLHRDGGSPVPHPHRSLAHRRHMSISAGHRYVCPKPQATLQACLEAEKQRSARLSRSASPAVSHSIAYSPQPERKCLSEALTRASTPRPFCCAYVGRGMLSAYGWARPCHICAGTGLTAATSALGLGSPLPHLHWDWAHICHICTGTGLTAAHICTETGLTSATSAPGLGSPLPHLHWDWAQSWHICTGIGLTPPHLHRDWAQVCASTQLF